MVESHEYPITLRWTGGKQGVTGSPDGLPALTVAAPPEFGGPAGVWSPEHLFVNALASCVMTTFLAIAELSKLTVKHLEVPATGTLERGEDRRYRISRIVVRPRVGIASEGERDKALRLLEKTEQVCLITNSIRSEVVLEPTIDVVP